MSGALAAAAVFDVLIAFVAFVVLPWAGMSMLARSLADSDKALSTNFRGRRVFLGLGVVWLFFAVGVVVMLAGFWATDNAVLTPTDSHLSASIYTTMVAIGLLAMACLTFGLIDDALGSSAERGFRGHLRAIAHGRLTTGMLKLLGISASAVLVVWEADGRLGDGSRGAVYVLVAAAAIALTSNFLNLTDLRPGRALKSYAALGVVALAVTAASLGFGPQPGGLAYLERAATVAIVALALLGPLLAVWRFDLGERGMLGDAGANAAGAVVGFLIVTPMPLWGVCVYAVVMLALNLASEKWSFSRVIEANSLLRWVDGLGRLPADHPVQENFAKTSPQSETNDGYHQQTAGEPFPNVTREELDREYGD